MAVVGRAATRFADECSDLLHRMVTSERSERTTSSHWARSSAGAAAAAIQEHYSIKGLPGGRPLRLKQKKSSKSMIPKGPSLRGALSYKDKMLHYDASLTAAEKAGLVEPPLKPLTVQEWQTAKLLSDGRVDEICSICREPYRDSSQVILACSHTFHERCFLSYLRFADATIARCPVCRTEAHDWTTHDGGLNAWRSRSATRIQRCWRGHRVRVRVMEGLPPGSRLRRRYAAQRLKATGRKIEKLGEARRVAVDKFLGDVDRSTLESSRMLRESLAAFESFRNGMKSAERGLPPVLLSGSASPSWLHEAVGKAIERGDCECPICYDQLRTMEEVEAPRQPARRAVTILSCSHLFHQKCLDSFESFRVFEKRFCPMCRQEYHRRPWPL
ncbi:RING finger protein 24 [Perkinsus olseni]|uniref:RING finger protein 24 n=1 Tax=Perkinsus olseni TaxID=32597 RepID=A0A7J6LAH6_PEROL|nr:RING finger protein 24 [Perkinsus olseni]